MAFSCLVAAYLIKTQRLPGPRVTRRCLRWSSELAKKSESFITLPAFLEHNSELCAVSVVGVVDVRLTASRVGRNAAVLQMTKLPKNTVCVASSFEKIEVFLKTSKTWTSFVSNTLTGDLKIVSETSDADMIGSENIEVNILGDI